MEEREGEISGEESGKRVGKESRPARPISKIWKDLSSYQEGKGK
jgi:hypothetical protein